MKNTKYRKNFSDQNKRPISKRNSNSEKARYPKDNKEEKKYQDIPMLEGRNPVIEAIKSGRTIEKILIAKGSQEGSIRQLIAMAREKGLVIVEVDREKLDYMSETKSHQGVIAITSPYKYVEVQDILNYAKEKGEKPFVIILDEIYDPHNLGAIIRTAEAVGAHGIIIPKRRAVGLTPTVAKASAGAIEYVKVAKVTNISQTINMLKENGLWIVGADMDGDKSYFESDFTDAIALVIGSEGEGISRLVKDRCDYLVNMPMKGKVSSLNASVAGAVLMYEVVRQRITKE